MAMLSNFVAPALVKNPESVKKIIAAGTALGASAGATNHYLKGWASRHKRARTKEKREAAKELLKTGQVHQYQANIRKVAAMAADLRQKGLGGTKRPPFATEDSKQVAFGMLRNSQNQNRFAGAATPRTLTKPGPTLKQLAPGV